ncbi:hypothetical protein BZA77DRAFT_326484 [Pyronema omphalodes]|nr:hypothetical protein BZA77DRAFT_326484 [Pyronema omphalodes]
MKTTTITLLALAASAIAAPLARRHDYSSSSSPQKWEKMETFPSNGNPNHAKRAHHEEIERFPASGNPNNEKRHQYQTRPSWQEQEEIEKFPAGDGKPNTADDRKRWVERDGGHTETFGEAEGRAGKAQKRQSGCLILCGEPELQKPATSLDAPVHQPEQVPRPAGNPATHAPEPEQDFRTAVEPQEGDPVNSNTFEDAQ